MKKMKWFMLFVLMAVLVAGCSSGSGKGKKISLAYVAWDSEIASTHVVKEVLEQKLGYKVEMLQVDAGPMFAGVADGSADAMVAAWMPVTHESYMERYGADVVDLGPNLDGARLGLAVPTYVDINSIEDLAAAGEEFNFTITGIEPGAGIMEAAENALVDYGLKDNNWKLLASSSAGMAQELQTSYADKEAIVVTAWTPHWKFGKMDLKYLEDPKGVFGGTEQIHTMVRKGLQEDHPEVYAFLDKFNWTPEEMAVVMVDVMEGKAPDVAAKAWVEANEERVNAWLDN